MEWIAELEDGRMYGPFNILAAASLVEKGLIQADSTLRKQGATAGMAPASHEALDLKPHTRSTEAEEDQLALRIEQLEGELRAMRGDLSQLKEPIAGGATASDERRLGPAIEKLTSKIEQTESLLHTVMSTHNESALALAPSPRQRPLPLQPDAVDRQWDDEQRVLAQERVYTYDEAFRLVRTRDYEARSQHLQELARARRYRAQTLRWNVIASSLLLGTGVTVGSLGYILEMAPIHITGLIISSVGVLYFVVALLLLMLRKAASWASLTLATAAESDIETADAPPVRGALNITFYWFNRTFRSKPSDDESQGYV